MNLNISLLKMISEIKPVMKVLVMGSHIPSIVAFIHYNCLISYLNIIINDLFLICFDSRHVMLHFSDSEPLHVYIGVAYQWMCEINIVQICLMLFKG